jgi:hypothetical protein
MNKEEFKNNAKKSIDDIFAKIDELEAKKDKAVSAAKIEFEEKIAELKLKKAELESKYSKLLNATEENWEEVKTAFASASVSFKEGFSKLASLFNKPEEKTQAPESEKKE